MIGVTTIRYWIDCEWVKFLRGAGVNDNRRAE